MKQQQVTVKQEVVATGEEPRVADVPPVFITAQEPTSSSAVSGQVEGVSELSPEPVEEPFLHLPATSQKMLKC